MSTSIYTYIEHSPHSTYHYKHY